MDGIVEDAVHMSSTTVTDANMTPNIEFNATMHSFTVTSSNMDGRVMINGIMLPSTTVSDANMDGHIGLPSVMTSTTVTDANMDGIVRRYVHDPQKYIKSERIFVLDRDERIVLVLSDDSVPYTAEPGITTELNGDVTLEIDVLATDSRVSRIVNDGRLVTRNENGDFMEFVIREIEDTFGDGRYKTIFAEGGEFELLDEFLPSYVQASVTLKEALDAILQGTRYEIGEIDTNFKRKSVELRHMSKRKAINEIINMWDGEIQYRVETDGNRVTKRYIDVFEQLGESRGKRVEAGKDIVSSKRVFDSQDVKTALYGYGASDEDGNRLTFADIEWKKDNGDPTDKPEGQTWIGDMDALAEWGYEGGTRHKEGFYDGQEEDPAELLLNTWNKLQEKTTVRDTYEVEVAILGEILDIPFEKVRLGDRVTVVDNEMNPPLHSTASVVEYEYNLNNPKLSKVTLGHFRAKLDTDERVSDLESDYNDNKGKWDKQPEKVKNQLQADIDAVLEEAQKKIDEAEEELKEALERIEDTKIDLEDAEDAIKNAIDRPQDYEGYFDGDIAARSITLWDEVISENARFTGTVQGNNLTFLRGDFEKVNVIDANIENATITGELNGVTGNFVGTVTAEKIEGSEISGVTFKTGRKNDYYIHMEEQEITLYEGSMDKMHIGFRNESGSLTQKPYMVWGYGKESNGRSQMVMEKDSNDFEMKYLAQGGDSLIRMSYGGSMTMETPNIIHMDPGSYVRVNSDIYADDHKTNSSKDIKDNIREFDGNATDLIKGTQVYSYNLKKDIEKGSSGFKSADSNLKEYIGFMADEADLIGDGESISLYKAISLAWKSLQEMNDRLEKVEG